MPTRAHFDEALLRAAVASSKNYREVAAKLYAAPADVDVRRVTRHVGSLCLDTSHFVRATGRMRGKKRSWSDDQLRAAVVGSKSVAQTICKLGLVPAGGNYDQVQRRIRELA